jgi:hypothetical protein
MYYAVRLAFIMLAWLAFSSLAWTVAWTVAKEGVACLLLRSVGIMFVAAVCMLVDCCKCWHMRSTHTTACAVLCCAGWAH